MSRAVGVQKPHEAQKAKTLWKMMAAKDAGEEDCDPERKDNILERNKKRLQLWEEHLKDPIASLEKSVEVRGEVVLGLILGPRPCGGSGLQWLVLPRRFELNTMQKRNHDDDTQNRSQTLHWKTITPRNACKAQRKRSGSRLGVPCETWLAGGDSEEIEDGIGGR